MYTTFGRAPEREPYYKISNTPWFGGLYPTARNTASVSQTTATETALKISIRQVDSKGVNEEMYNCCSYEFKHSSFLLSIFQKSIE